MEKVVMVVVVAVEQLGMFDYGTFLEAAGKLEPISSLQVS